MPRIIAIIEKHAALLWGIVLMAAVYSELAYMAGWLGLWENSLPSVRALKIAADAAVIMMPYWLLPGRWRLSALVPVWGVAAMCICNSFYYRFFTDCMPPEALAQGVNADAALVGSVTGACTPSDVAALAVPVVATALWCIRRVRRAVQASDMRAWLRVTMCTVTAVLFVLAQIAHNNAIRRELTYHYGRDVSHSEILRFRITGRDDSQIAIHDSSLRQSGAVVYMLVEAYNFLSAPAEIKLTAQESERFDSLLLHKAETDSTTRKNVIFIIAESLNAEMIGRRAGHTALTPVLDSLIGADGSVVCLNVAPQVDKGMSSDGQLMYNLGTLPLLNGAPRSRQLRGKELPTLAKQLTGTHRSVAIFAENGRTWDERGLYGCYGYDEVLTSDGARRHADFDSLGADMATMQYAVMVADTLAQPFFMQILTVSTHFPFDARLVPECELPPDGALSARENAYRSCVHYLDRSVGVLLDGLRERGLLENTMIVVASDHHINMDGGIGTPRPIAFIAANCDTTATIGEAKQADVFPTLCHLMSLRGRWRGTGRNMLAPEEGDDSERGRRSLSDSLLRSDYFNRDL